MNDHTRICYMCGKEFKCDLLSDDIFCSLDCWLEFEVELTSKKQFELFSILLLTVKRSIDTIGTSKTTKEMIMTDIIIKLAKEWKESDDMANKWSKYIAYSKTAESKEVCFSALTKQFGYRATKANVLAMAICKELGL